MWLMRRRQYTVWIEGYDQETRVSLSRFRRKPVVIVGKTLVWVKRGLNTTTLTAAKDYPLYKQDGQWIIDDKGSENRWRVELRDGWTPSKSRTRDDF